MVSTQKIILWIKGDNIRRVKLRHIEVHRKYTKGAKQKEKWKKSTTSPIYLSPNQSMKFAIDIEDPTPSKKLRIKEDLSICSKFSTLSKAFQIPSQQMVHKRNKVGANQTRDTPLLFNWSWVNTFPIFPYKKAHPHQDLRVPNGSS